MLRGNKQAVTKFILAIDQGTTSSTALVMGADGTTLGRATEELPQHFPKPGWVEHDPSQIWEGVLASVTEALRQAGISGESLAAVGITNQRETTLLWDRASGEHVHRAIVWQDRRTAAKCQELRERGVQPEVRQRTGLVVDPYFSGTKLAWMLNSLEGVRARAVQGKLAFGTIDSFLMWKLTNGEKHVIDVTNASRTLLMDLKTLQWSPEMLALLEVPEPVLPQIVPSAGKLGMTRAVPGLPDGIPITGIAGDQHAALFGQACFSPGEGKCTYGTGAFVLVNTGDKPVMSEVGLLTTLGWQVGNEVVYALEGSSFIAGAAVQWLRDGLGVIEHASQVEALAREVDSSDGVVFVPALAGLGAPYWDAEARGLICGITRGTTRAQLARATLEAIAYQVDDLIVAMSNDLGRPVTKVRVDGGAAANNLLMQLQSDISAVLVERPKELESTARGAAMLAGVGAGLFESGQEAARLIQLDQTFQPQSSDEDRQSRRQLWHDAVRRALSTRA